MKAIFCFSVSALLLGSATSHATIIIDDFSTTQVQPPSSSGAADGPGIIGGERFVEGSIVAVDINSAVPNQLEISNSDPLNSAKETFYYDAGLAHLGGWEIGGLGHVDFTQGGINNGFLVNVTSATGSGSTITLWLQHPNFIGSAITLSLPTTPGVMEIPFADFGIGPLENQLVDFTDVGDMLVSFDLNPGASYTIDSITVDSIGASSNAPDSTTTAGLLSVSICAVFLLGRKYGVQSSKCHVG